MEHFEILDYRVRPTTEIIPQNDAWAGLPISLPEKARINIGSLSPFRVLFNYRKRPAIETYSEVIYPKGIKLASRVTVWRGIDLRRVAEDAIRGAA